MKEYKGRKYIETKNYIFVYYTNTDMLVVYKNKHRVPIEYSFAEEKKLSKEYIEEVFRQIFNQKYKSGMK